MPGEQEVRSDETTYSKVAGLAAVVAAAVGTVKAQRRTIGLNVA